MKYPENGVQISEIEMKPMTVQLHPVSRLVAAALLFGAVWTAIGHPFLLLAPRAQSSLEELCAQSAGCVRVRLDPFDRPGAWDGVRVVFVVRPTITAAEKRGLEAAARQQFHDPANLVTAFEAPTPGKRG